MNANKGKARARWATISRITAATLGGYAVVSLIAVALAGLLAMPRLDAFLVIGMTGLVLYVVLIAMVFHVRDAGRAWLWLAFAALPALAIILWGSARWPLP